ncbi:Hypothetical predicted protein [Mytilus galloprovincialis]|uniref:DNA-directed DNA polymerase n=1 Tax=Mytilus galloprovincialis TaxID=29158 RepID=A0A8B6GPZ8_MYTGA|nr:Hypothetical predicted protein [Mytilus galloprovincialis]
MEAKKDKILSKRGDSYKLVLTKEYKHKASIYVFNYKISLKDEKQETFTNAFDHMVDYSIKDYPNGRIKIVPIHEIIITKHKSWPIRTYNTVKKLFMDQMERLLNSAEELNLEEVIFEVTIIPNKRGKEYNIMIQHAKRGGEKKLFINNKCYKVDGYYYDRENKMRNVYEFFGCYWHGCTKCYSPEEICKKDRNKKTMKELYDQTKERLKTIEDYLKPNVKIHTIWECEFDQQKYPEVDPHLKPIDKRDAFYGGRTETIQLYNNLSDLKGRYVDFCSLYPSVNKYCKYPIGHPITYTDISVDDYIKNRNYFGIMKCKILPPKGLYHPVLPYKQSTSDNTHKLLFGLCRTCMNKISFKCKHIDASSDPTLNKHDKIHEIKRCKECKNIKNEKCIHSDEERVIVDTFMKYKQEASGCKCDPKYCKNDCKNDKECKTKIQYIIDNTAYDLDIDKVKYNSGLRFIAKICLNNLWGHFGMRDNFTQKEYCFTLEHITKIVFNEKYKDISTMILDEDIVLTEYKNKEEYSKPNPSVNVYIALFTTAHARLKLYELLDILQERVLYMDTDSCIYNDDGSEACKKIESMMGNKLGDLTDEIVSKHNANHIKQFISAGPKDYSMKLDTEKLVSCCKGFRLNAEVEKKITLDKKIKIVTDENEKYETVKYNNIKIGKDHQLKTVKQVKAYDYMFDKRMVYCENENLIRSFPYGY